MRHLIPLAAALLTALSAVATAQTLPNDFVYLRDIDRSILQDIRYAGANNFMGRPIKGYDAAECVVKRAVGLALKNVQRELAAQHLSLKMMDCYRPARAVADMVAWSRNGRETPAERRYNPSFAKQDLFRLGYIATHSQHSTGAAVDLTLVDLKADNSASFDPNKLNADRTIGPVPIPELDGSTPRMPEAGQQDATIPSEGDDGSVREPPDMGGMDAMGGMGF